MNQTFLFELGCEELPARMQKDLAQELYDNTRKQLLALGVLAEDETTNHTLLVTPRRLAVRFTCKQAQEDKTVELWGPPKSVAFDAEGKPGKAAEIFAQKNGVALADLSCQSDGKVEKLFCKKLVAGRATVELLPEVMVQAVKALNLAKPMRWGAESYSFIRPVHWLVALFGNEIVPVEMFGLKADRLTYGHRFHAPQAHSIAHTDAYEEILKDAHVVVDRAARMREIKAQVSAKAIELGAVSVFDQGGFDGDSWDGLLDEVTGLVEWPVAVVGEFEARFLAVPQECLISTMRDNQRYFHLVDGHGKLMNHFIIISHIDSTCPRSIAEGNAKVIRPRFADAEFFFEQDKKKKLDDRRAALSNVVFQKELGTLADKSLRVAELAEKIAREIGADGLQARRAGELCKCDLLSLMVNEFPELQGIMGNYYARIDVEPEAVAQAIEEHYWPKFAGDRLPQTSVGIALALADRIDTLVGIFGIGQAPNASKDPFALRRAAISVLRIMVEHKLDLDLRVLIGWAREALAARVTNANVETDVLAFVFERFRAGYQDQGIATEIVNAVMALNPTRPLDFDKRVQAVQVFNDLPEASALAAANKRVRNILAKADLPLDNLTIEDGALIETAEQHLAAALRKARHDTLATFAGGQYTEVLQRLAELRAPIDTFFDQVMVNSPQEQVRRNRFALLKELQSLFTAVADISQLPG